MKVGFIGAGKVGVSIGKYFAEHGVHVTGYYSKTWQSSLEAAEFTNTTAYEHMRELVEVSDTIFITVPDGMIQQVWDKLKVLSIENKVISHFSGSLSSALFTDIRNYHAYGYSIHPLFAINDKHQSYKELSESFFTIEGHEKYLDTLVQLFERLGNKVKVIPSEEKTRYHAAATMVSNLYVGLVSLGEKMLEDCGFESDEAHQALIPLIQGNTANILSYGPQRALTGPIERNDTETIRNHLEILESQEKEVYQVLSNLVLKLAEEKHKDRNYTNIRRMMKE
ncbi:Rossmann-like and DUF2520 domain-containing protein [Ornithinibacillus halophilus]|uniref:Predicted oxidoreductase, contains short-chain dehydrogenase (SDR) and DUF2520 domains n=1 Tax=Ornithinibacillus halophilus TaxID=930117 RepID=A0A1M5J5C0_9BACI|nr:Rossmann-like and DUF2520 domain-containing protein [Ornithinibacillus halophilus]SHG35711.1 Predicted oxidoreductase, contains short-chain dehydrogenase (SDR) and DUF2520 domains [Ornithinibacillus halophilus]